MDPALLINRYQEGVIALGPQWLIFCVGSRLYIVLTGVTLWFVTNLLTLSKIRILECVTGCD